MPFLPEQVVSIIQKSRRHEKERPWIEFKMNRAVTPLDIGEYISALANTAALYNQSCALVIWGIDDKTHEIRGTTFDPDQVKQGNQGLTLFVSTQLEPQVQFYFHKATIEGCAVVLLEIHAAGASPVKFRGIDYIRLDSHKKKLKDFPDTERELWAALAKKTFESMVAMEDIPADFVLRLLNYPAYFELLSRDLPEDRTRIIGALIADGMIAENLIGNYNITNVGAILFANNIENFPSLARKAVRIIRYGDNTRLSAATEKVFTPGYAAGFEALIAYVNDRLPQHEVMGAALRRTVPMYPPLVVRESIANALIHQNFFQQGAGPMVEIFSDRVEITNPGTPLIETDRFLDSPPISRNERLAAFLRRIGVCEERGSGFDKIVYETEKYQLPAPEIEVYANTTRLILFSHRAFSQMSKADRLRACYLHAALQCVNRSYMTNATLRARFSVPAKNSATISRLIGEASEEGLIKLADEANTAARSRRYVPYWA